MKEIFENQIDLNTYHNNNHQLFCVPVDPVKGKVEASNEEEINKDQKDSFESEAVIKDFVVKILKYENFY